MAKNHSQPVEPTVILEDETLKLIKGFTQLPNFVLKHPVLSFGAKLTYALLLSYAWQENFCYPAQEKLGADLGVTRRSISNFLKELKEVELIRWKRQGLNRPNIYYLLDVKQSSHPDVKQTLHQEVTPRSHKEYPIKNTQNVNVVKKPSRGVDNLDMSIAIKEDIVREILQVTGDPKSLRFYRKVARACPEDMIFAALSETRYLDKTAQIKKNAGACFTDLVKRSAQDAGIRL